MGVFYAYPTVYEKNTFQGWIGGWGKRRYPGDI